MFDTQYYLCLMFCVENWIVVRVELTNAILWRCNSAIDLCSQDVIVGMYMVFLYILVFAFYVQNRKSFCHCRTQLRRCKSFKPCWFVAYVKKNVFVLQASQRHDQDSWCRIFFWHNLWRLHCLCDIFLMWDMFAFSLFVLR